MRREELLSLRLHEAVAEKLQSSPELIERVAGKVERLYQMGQLHPYYREAWLNWLTLSVDEQVSKLVSVDEESISLRQTSPFAGFLSIQERMSVLRSFKEEWASRCDATHRP